MSPIVASVIQVPIINLGIVSISSHSTRFACNKQRLDDFEVPPRPRTVCILPYFNYCVFILSNASEIIGVVRQIGDKVQNLKVGDRVGVGPLSDSCGKCEECRTGREQLCPKPVSLYNSVDKEGHKTYGGFSNMVPFPLSSPRL